MPAKARLRPNRPATVKEAADYLHCSKRAVYNWISEGRLQAWKLGPHMFRVDMGDVEKLYVLIITEWDQVPAEEPAAGELADYLGYPGADARPPRIAALAAGLALPIEELNLTARACNSLRRGGIRAVGDLIARTEEDLRDIRNLGAKSIEDIKQRLADADLALKGETLNGLRTGT